MNVCRHAGFVTNKTAKNTGLGRLINDETLSLIPENNLRVQRREQFAEVENESA